MSDRNGVASPADQQAMQIPGAAFMVSAPGKVIVFGEHAVVYGKAAMAAAISLRSYLLVTPLSKIQRTVTLRFLDIALEHTWTIESLPWSAFSAAHKVNPDQPVTTIRSELREAMQPCLDLVSPNVAAKERKIHQAAASTFLYLYMSLSSADSAGCIYTLRSTIPIGAGLGSSASISVCLSTALLYQTQALHGPASPIEEVAKADLASINHWAFLGEVLVHGTPSGVDNTVSTQGKAVTFKRPTSGEPPVVTSLQSFPKLALLLIDTREPKSTAEQVAKVAKLKQKHPRIVDSVLNGIDSITERAHALFANAPFDSADVDNVTGLGELVNLNHGLLYTLGVSHPRLEQLKEMVDKSGIGWTKLTGSGGGGCAFTLLRTRDGLEALENRLEQEGFVQYATTLGGEGVGLLHLDGMCSNGPRNDINQESFCAASGGVGVEALVGGTRPWQYWTS